MAFLTINPGIKPQKKDSNVLGAIAYLPFGSLLIPLIIYLVAKEDKYVRYHALNALGFDIALMVLGIVFGVIGFVLIFGIIFLAMATSGLGFILFPVVWLLVFTMGGVKLALSLYFMYLSYNGNAFEIPVVTKYIKQYV